MWHSPVDAFVVFGTGVPHVAPSEGSASYVRKSDGAISRRHEGVMFWFVAVERDFVAIATQSVDEDVLEVDEMVGELAAVIEELPERSRATVRRGAQAADRTRPKEPGGNDERTRRENSPREGRSSAARPIEFSSPPREQIDAEAVKR